MSTAKKATDTDPDAFDLDAVQAEARGDPFVFTFGGRQWTLSHMQDLDYRVLAAGDGGDQAMARESIRLGLGDQFEAFSELLLSLKAFDHLFGQWMRHSGIERGNSQASTGS